MFVYMLLMNIVAKNDKVHDRLSFTVKFLQTLTNDLGKNTHNEATTRIYKAVCFCNIEYKSRCLLLYVRFCLANPTFDTKLMQTQNMFQLLNAKNPLLFQKHFLQSKSSCCSLDLVLKKNYKNNRIVCTGMRKDNKQAGFERKHEVHGSFCLYQIRTPKHECTETFAASKNYLLDFTLSLRSNSGGLRSCV